MRQTKRSSYMYNMITRHIISKICYFCSFESTVEIWDCGVSKKSDCIFGAEILVEIPCQIQSKVGKNPFYLQTKAILLLSYLDDRSSCKSDYYFITFECSFKFLTVDRMRRRAYGIQTDIFLWCSNNIFNGKWPESHFLHTLVHFSDITTRLQWWKFAQFKSEWYFHVLQIYSYYPKQIPQLNWMVMSPLISRRINHSIERWYKQWTE